MTKIISVSGWGCKACRVIKTYASMTLKIIEGKHNVFSRLKNEKRSTILSHISGCVTSAVNQIGL